MNMGIITSFAVGGLLLLSILFFQSRFQSHTQETTIAAMTTEQMDDLVTILSHDISRIGYQYGNVPIVTYNASKLVFFGDIYDTDELDATQVSWSWEKNIEPVNSTSNPNDYYLVRRGPVDKHSANGTLKFPVTHFNLRYLSALNEDAPEAHLIKEIIVEVMVESGEPYGFRKDGTPLYYRTVYKRSFFPTNLNKSFY